MLAGDPRVERAAVDHRGPAVISRPAEAKTFAWLAEHRMRIHDLVASHGGVLLRDLGFISESEFYRAMWILSPEPLDRVHAATRRHRRSGWLAATARYPADRAVPPHNQNSCTSAWPSRIYRYCLVPAEFGGEAITVDARAVYRRIDPAVRDRFERKGVLYVHSFTKGHGPSWQEVFHTDNRAEVERYCAAHGTEFEWDVRGAELVTSQRRPATVVHPVTAERVWFNQAHLFHFSALEAGERASLVQKLGMEALPHNAYYGDGAPIDPASLDHVRDAYEREMSLFTWRRGHIMVLDNLLFAHGRTPFAGLRKIVTAMV